MLSVAVIIPCHNYGRFLPDCINSVMKQSVKPNEILIVDDDSTDNTAEIAVEAATKFGVKYIKVNHHSLPLTRKSGMDATKSEVLIFLDADDMIYPNYIESGLRMFYDQNGQEQHRMAIVYSDIIHFGNVGALKRRFRSVGLEHKSDDEFLEPSMAITVPMTKRFDPCLLEHVSYMHAGSLVRRRALEQHPEIWTTQGKHYHEDWWMFRALTRQGWQATRQTDYYCYRIHDKQMTNDVFTDSYFDRSACWAENVTIFTPFSGRRKHLLGYFDWLERQTWPKDQTSLWFYNTSSDPEFGSELRRYMANCGYPNIKYTHKVHAPDGLADLPRAEHAKEVRRVCARIYNDMGCCLDTPYVLIVEDDIVPPDNVIDGGFRAFAELVGAIIMPYKSRYHEGYALCRPGQAHPFIPAIMKGTGVEQVGGGGMGCVLAKRSLFHQYQFTHYSTDFPHSHDFDVSFWQRIQEGGNAINTDWSLECQHLE